MKTLLNLLNRTANAAKISGGGSSRTTKHLFAIIALLLTFGVGNVWAGTKRIYCEYSAVSRWWGSTVYVYAWGGGHDAKKYTMTATGTTDLMRCDIDDYHTNLLFYKSDSVGGPWSKQSNDVTIGSNNRWSMQDGGWDNNCTINNEQRYAPGTAIDGLVDIKNPHNQAFVDGEFTATLEARKTYEFKIIDGTTLYGLNDNVWTSSVSEYTLKSGEYQIRLCTAGAGTYTFTWDGANKKLSVEYPDVEHPNIDYCYVINYSWSPSTNIHVWNGSSSKVAEWNGNSTIAGTTFPGTQLYNTTTIGGTSYFYIAPGEYANFLVSKKGDATDRSGDLTTSEGYGKRRYYNGSTWVWDTFTVRIQLNDLSATTSVNPTYMDVAFNSDVLTDLTSAPVKNNYTFGGFYTNSDGSGTQVINANGEWIASVAGYTDAFKHWIHAGTSTTLYAKWTEIKHDVTVAVSPAGAGSVQVNSSNVSTVTNVGVSTKSAEMTPIALAGWKFKEWQVTSNVQMDLVNYHSDYQQGTANKMKINATADEQTITAVFEPRYYLVGKIWDDSADGGMPGWDNYNKPFKVVTTSPVLDTCKLTLSTNKSFYIEVRDKVDGFSYGKSGGISLGDDASITFTDQDNKVLFYSNGGTNYTFKITAVDGSGRPTVSVERPHQMHFAHKRVDIDGNEHNDDLGGTLTATINSGSAIDEQWFDYGSDVSWTATAETGYSLTWYTDNAYSNAMNPQPDASWNDPGITHDENIYAKFTEKATTVTLSNDGHGHVEIGGATVANTTVGVTTTRELTAVPNEGYMFSSWTETAKTDYTTSSTSTNPTTLRGGGSGTASQTLTANFTHRWALKAESDGWGSAEFIIGNISVVGGKTIGYVDISLAANTNYQFTMKDLLTSDIYKNNNTAVQYMTYTIHTDWGFDKTYTFNCGITTAGKGTYRFTWNVTDKTMTVTYPTSYQVNYGSSVGGSVTSVKDGDNNDVPNGGYVCSGGRVTYTAAANAYYTFVGWCNNETYGAPFNTVLSWTNSNVTETQNSFAKFKSTNFVIYRSGDMAEDDRAALDDVESFAGGTISEAIEFRMKVHTLDQWYSLCLPFTVNAVKVWDDEDNEYYDIEPYYRTAVGEPLQGGYYIIRTPSSTTDFPIANFNDWRDPTSPTGYVPTKNTPYIIQWHMSYFSGKYISFFGATGQEIDDEFTAGTAPSADNVVNIYGNNAMVSDSVAGAYMLEPDYGSDGAWLRLEDASASRTVLPFECYILASVPTRTRYRVIRPGMPTDDTPTGWDDVVNTEPRTDIMVYTITGFPVARYSDCSFAEAARRLKTGHGEGIYILRSGNESVKLMVGGK